MVQCSEESRILLCHQGHISILINIPTYTFRYHIADVIYVTISYIYKHAISMTYGDIIK